MASPQAHQPPSPKRQPAVLARYGGQAGPTGTANPGTGASPVSLANFMGGKATGPRLGKLVGDGRSAPPEAELIHDNYRRGVPLPGLASQGDSAGAPGGAPGAKSLASFLEARAAQQQGNSNSSSSSSSHVSTPPIKSQSIQIPTHGETVSSPALPAPSRQTPLRGSSTSAAMKDAATSPARTESPTSIDREAPTRSVNNLHAQGMVKQRLQEAKQREANKPDAPSSAAATSTSTSAVSPAASSPSKWPKVSPASSLSHGSGSSANAPKWPPVNAPPSLATSSSSSGNTPTNLPPPARYNPARSGNALPGLSRPSSSSSTASRVSSSSPTRASYDERTSADLSPVRLPGMGGPVSPFKNSANAGDGFFGKEDVDTSAEAAPATTQQQPLESLTSNRARGPARRAPRTAGETTTSVPAPSTFTRTVPPNDDPTMSKLLSSTEQDTVRPIASTPSSTSNTTPSVMEVEESLKNQSLQEATAPASTHPPRSTSGPRIVVLISGSGSNLQALIDATQAGGSLSHAQITYVISNRKAAYGLQRAASSNPPIPTQVLAFKTWQNKNGGVGTREEYDEVLAKAILDGHDGRPPHLVVLAGFMHIVSPQFLRALGHPTELDSSGGGGPSWRPSYAIPVINLHPALPGAFDGVNAIARAHEAFQSKSITHTGIMVHEVVAEVDRGAPIVVEQVAIYEGESLEELEKRMHDVEHQLIVKGARITLDKSRARWA